LVRYNFIDIKLSLGGHMIILTKPDYEFRMKYINSIIQRYHKLDKKGKSKVIDEALRYLDITGNT
jgi:hypothetical protein